MTKKNGPPPEPSFRDRVVAAYRAATGAETDRGALSWFGAKVGRDRRTASDWAWGRYSPPDDVIEALGAVEAAIRASGGPTEPPFYLGGPERRTERNEAIRTALAGGASIGAVAKEHGICRSRVVQIRDAV